MELSSHKLKKLFLKNFLYFRRELAKPKKQKFLIFLEMKLSSAKIKKVVIFF